MIKYAILTVSDGVAHGTRQDLSHTALYELMSEHELVTSAVVPDVLELIQAQLENFISDTDAELVLTTGGTGLSPRDVTPEATLGVAEYEVPGLAEQMRAVTRDKSPRAVLSRAVVAVSGRVLIVNLPGSPRGATEMLSSILDVLPHALDILRGDTQHTAGGS